MIITPDNLPVLDRRVKFDEKSRRFAAVGPNDDREFVSKEWPCDVYNDQGKEGACVGFAWSHELSAEPQVIRRDATFAHQIYNRAKQIDEWDGDDYSGTSVLAGVKAVQEILNSQGKRMIEEYRWAFGIQDVMRVVGYDGPVVLGIEWHNDMYYPKDNNWITPTGGVAGGHAIMCKGVNIVKRDSEKPATWDNLDLEKSNAILHNSWGTSYGDGGDAYISIAHLAYLLERNGEACIPVVRGTE